MGSWPVFSGCSSFVEFPRQQEQVTAGAERESVGCCSGSKSVNLSTFSSVGAVFL